MKTRRHPFEWTPERIAQLKKLHKNDLSFGKIAKIMGVKVDTISGKVSRLKLVNNRSNPAYLRGERRGEVKTEVISYKTPSLAPIPAPRVQL